MNDFFDSLSEKQKEELLILVNKNLADKTKVKRKQIRKNKNSDQPTEQASSKRIIKKSTKQKSILRKTQPAGSSSKGAPAQIQTFDMKERPNNFITSVDFKKHRTKKEREIEAGLATGRVQPDRNRKTSYTTAICVRCEYEFENVPSYRCYKDQDKNEVMFTCDECSIDRRST